MKYSIFKGVGYASALAGVVLISVNIYSNAEEGDAPKTASNESAPHVVGYERFHSAKPSVAGGAILFSELGCANCHGDSPVATPRKGPNLVDLKQRVDHDWITAFLKNPEAGRTGSTMPKMTHGLSDEDVESIVAYLGTKGKGAKLKRGRHANAERGSALYHEKGCVACHSPTPDFHPPHGKINLEDYSLAISHPDMQKKTSLFALSHFLIDPSRYRPDGRMPHIALDEQQSVDIAAHLLGFQSSDPTKAKNVKPWPKANADVVKKGEELVQKMNCASCHSVEGEKAQPVIKLTSKVNSGGHDCLTGKPIEGLPFYNLTDTQTESLKLYLANTKLDGAEKVSTTLAAMNCYACHQRDGIGGPTEETDPWFIGDKGLGDSGRLAPPLTGIGFKLQRKWMEGMLNGAHKKVTRPYLKTQMPVYKNQAKALSDLLEKTDAKKAAFEVLHSPETLSAGKKLLGTQGGVNCITCHTWEGKPSIGIQALDLSSLDQRLRPEWFHEYMINPAVYRPGTLMPDLWPSGKSSAPDVLEGNTDKQIAAIWAFIEKGKGLPEGFPDRSGGKFELVPKDRPIIQRTFFKGTGTKAILVGFPGKIHIAYDGLNAHPSFVWKGDFFDAYNTWFSRFAPFESPLGEKVSEFPKPKTKSRFRGYRIDDAGNPIFLIESNGRALEERFLVKEGKLYRVISWEKGDASEVMHPKGVEIKKELKANKLTFIYSWN